MLKLDKLKKWQIAVTLATSIFYFTYYMGRYNYSATIPFIQREFNLSNTAVGAMATVLTAGYAVGQFVNGYLIDKYGPRKMMSLGGILSTATNILTSVMPTFSGILASWGLNGYVQAFGYPSCCKIYASWFKPEGRGKPLGFNESLQSFSSTIIVPLSAFIIVAYGWRMVYIIPVIPMALISFLMWRFMKDSPWKAGLIENYDETPIVSPLNAYKITLGDWRMIASYISYGGSQFGRFAIYTWVPAYIYSLTGNIITGGFVAAAFALGGTFGSLIVGWLSDVFKKRWPVIAIGMIISGLSLFVFAVNPHASPAILSILMAICGSGIEAVEVAYFLLPMDIMDDLGLQASGVGTMNAFGKFFATFQGVLMGALLDTSGYMMAFIVVGVVCIISAGLVVPIRK